MMTGVEDGDFGFGNGLDFDFGALMETSEHHANGLDFTAKGLMQLGFNAEMIAWCMDTADGTAVHEAHPDVDEEFAGEEASAAMVAAADPAATAQRFQLTRVHGTDTFDLDFAEVRLEDLMTLTAPCVLARLSDCALARLLYEYHMRGALHGITVVGKRDFQLKRVMDVLIPTHGVVGESDARTLLNAAPLSSNIVADHLATVTNNHTFRVARDFLAIYHGYSTGGEMQDVTIQACEALLPRIQQIGYIAFSNAVVARIMDNHEHHVEARNGKKKARDDDLEGITMMKCVMEDILNRVERMYDQLDRRGLHEFTYMDSCRVTFGIFHVGLRRWAESGFTAPYPGTLKLRTVDLNSQMVSFHRALFTGPQFEHLHMDMYTVADIHLATSCVYFNFCSIGGVEGVTRFKTWYAWKLAQGVSNCNMPLVSFTVRGMNDKLWKLMTADCLMRLCSMRSSFLTFEPTMESDDGTQLVWLAHDSKKPKNASAVRVLNMDYGGARMLHSANLVPKVVRHSVQAGKARKAQAVKAKAVRKAKREAKM